MKITPGHTSEDEGLDKILKGLLPLIDVVFGTYYMPENRLPTRLGLKHEEVPEGFWSQLAYPSRRRLVPHANACHPLSTFQRAVALTS